MALLRVAQNAWLVRPNCPKFLRGVRILFAMDTLAHFKEVYATELESLVNGEWAALGGKINKSTYWVTFPDGSIIRPFPADQATSSKVLGTRCDIIVVDEADDVSIAVLEAKFLPLLTEPWSFHELWIAGTPRRGTRGLLHKFFKLGQLGDPAYWSRHATYKEAGSLLDLAYVESQRKLLAPAIFSREYEANFTSAEGLVYGGTFDERFHVREHPQGVGWTEVLIGGDFGHRDPGVLLLIGVLGSGHDAVCYVVDEVYATDKLEDWWVEKMQAWMAEFPYAKLYHDPSAANRIEAYRKKAGARPQKPIFNNPIEGGVEVVANMFSIHTVGEGENLKRTAHLYIHPRCRNLIWELGMYRRKQDPHNHDAYLEEIQDGNDHACFVAGTLVRTDTGEKPIELVRAGDLVETRSGLRAVTAAGLTSKSVPTFRVTTSLGQSLEATGNHPVWVEDRGWTRVDTLRYGDILYAWQKPSGSTGNQKRLSSTGLPIGDIQNQPSESFGYISGQPVESGCMSPSGSAITDQSKKGITYTTKTRTHSTTTSVTSSANEHTTTLRSTQHQKQENVLDGGSSVYSHSPKCGTPLPRDCGGILKTVSEHGLNANPSGSPVNNAGLSSTQSVDGPLTVFAPTIASRSGADMPGSTMSTECARNAGQVSGSTNTDAQNVVPVVVESVEAIEREQPVYNLTVDGEHEYFANGILVSNCDALRYAIATRFGSLYKSAATRTSPSFDDRV